MTVRVRVVEDAPELSFLLGQALERAGYDVSLTVEGFTALLTPYPWDGIDVALVDLMMPEVGGIDILAYLALEHPSIHRLAMTASIELAGEAMGLADTCLIKPFSPDQLIDLLRGYGGP